MADGEKGRIQRGGEATRRRVDVSIKDVEEGGAKVNGPFFSKETSPLSQGEVFVSATEGPSAAKRPGFIAEGKGGRNAECRRVPERGSHGVEIGLIGLADSGNDIDSGDSGEMAPCKQDIASRSAARAVNRRWNSRFVAGDA